MEKFELSIPDDFIEDFTIYYVGSDGLNEINTSKDENKITNEITERNKLTKNLEKEIKDRQEDLLLIQQKLEEERTNLQAEISSIDKEIKKEIVDMF
ncbi:hypothetical protein M9Y10_010880 [Tritrichomonas musculus]|uniref:Uncharacterized protein n=1 Tax=Tritrichomonas musculus TaxID=1915356 RepID=A0ABR2IPG5_9EUKA